MSDAQERVGVIEQVLPRRLFRVRAEDGSVLTVSVALAAQRTHVSFLPGDTVLIRVSPYEPSRGRISRKL